jgi:hypothetical protein
MDRGRTEGEKSEQKLPLSKTENHVILKMQKRNSI